MMRKKGESDSRGSQLAEGARIFDKLTGSNLDLNGSLSLLRVNRCLRVGVGVHVQARTRA